MNFTDTNGGVVDKPDRAQLICLAQKEDLDGLLVFMKDKKTNDQDLFDMLASCSKSQLDDIWEGVQKMSLVTLLLLDPRDGGESLEKCLSVLNAVLPLAVCTLNQNELYIPGHMLEVAVLLHGILTSLPEDEDKLKNNLCKFFEKWWKLDLDRRNELGAETLTYLLERSLKLNKVAISDIKRVWDMREILTVLHLHTESGKSLVELLQKCFRKSKYMTDDAGRRFLSFLLTLTTDLVETFHETIKSIMPDSPKLWWEKYGEIYFHAWQRSSGTIREKIEHYCIQDLISHGVHADRSGPVPMSSILLRVLGYIHKQKKQKQVNEMLLRLYSPILWRSLKVANPTVRANAVLFLCDVFPLTDPDANSRDSDALMQKQFDLLLMLLFDNSHTVRVITIQGVCRIMSIYWEMIPVAVIKSVVTKLVKELVYDVSCAEVRQAVFQSLTSLLDNNLCHPLMKTVLPQLGEFIFDSAESVRIAVLELLLRVRPIRNIKLLTIVPMEHLLSRLESDTPSVCRRIVKLLYPSFIVLDKPADVQISRIIHMVELNPAASRVFFLYAVKLMTVQETVNYMTTLCRFVLLIAVKENRSNQDADEDSSLPPADDSQADTELEADEGEGVEDEMTMKDENTLTKLLDGLVIMWTSITNDLFKTEHIDLKRDLQKKMSIAIPQMLKAFQTPNAYNAIIMMASNVSPNQVPMLSRSCMSKLRKMDVEMNEDDYGVLLEAMCKWGKGNEVLEQVSDWLKSEVTHERNSLPTASKKGKKTKKNVCIIDPINPKPKLAVKFLTYLLRHPICQQILLSQNKEDLSQIWTILADVQMEVDSIVCGDEKPAAGVDPDFLESAFSTYLSLCVLLNNADKEAMRSVKTLKDLVIWADSVLVPALVGKHERSGGHKQKRKLYNTTLGMSMLEPGNLSETLQPKTLYDVTLGPSMLMSNDKNVAEESPASVTEMSSFAGAECRSRKRPNCDDAASLAQKILKKLLEFSSNALMVGIGDAEFTNNLCNLCVGCLPEDKNLEMLEKVLNCLFQVEDFRHVNRYETEDVDVSIPHCMSKIFNAMATYLKLHRTSYEKLFSEVRRVLSDIFSTVMRHRVTDGGEIHKELIAQTVAAILAEHAHASEEDDLGNVRTGITSLPPLSALLLTILHKNITSRGLFTQELLLFVKSAPITGVHMIHGCIHLVVTLCKTKFSDAVLSECLDSVKAVMEDLEPGENTDTTFRETINQINNKIKMDTACQKEK